MAKTSLCVFFYQHKQFAESCIRSIGALRQMPDEIVLCDDGSNDGTAEIVRNALNVVSTESKITLEFNRVNIGLIPQVERAIAASTGDLIIFLGGDDEAAPDLISTCATALRAEDVMGVAVNPELIDENGASMGRLRSVTGNETLTIDTWLFREPIYHCAFRREVFDKFGSLQVGGAEDIQLLFREVILGKVEVLDSPLIRYRRHGASLSGIASTTSNSVDEWARRMRALSLLHIRSLEGCLSTLRKSEDLHLISWENAIEAREAIDIRRLRYEIDHAVMAGKRLPLSYYIPIQPIDNLPKAWARGLLEWASPSLARRLKFRAYDRYLKRRRMA
jgi:glycosyltransferase involved in cell wall biosynthesis